MLTMVLWTLLALAAAAGVLVVAGSAGAGGTDRRAGVRTYLEDVRAGVRTWRSERRGGSRPASVPEPVDTTIDDLLAATAVQDPAYLAVEDLAETLARARERAARGVQGLSPRR